MTSAAHRSLTGLLARPAALSRALATDRPVHRWVLACTAVLPVLLTAGWTVADTRQPADYSPVRQTVSVLSSQAGTDRWIVTAVLYLVGTGYLLTAYGLTAVGPAARVGLVVAGAAAIGVASFPEPLDGSSQPHAVCAGIGAVTIAVWPVLVARRGSAGLSALGLRTTVAACIASLVLFFWTALEIRGTSLGLAERMSSSLQVSWPFVIALALRRAGRDQPPRRARP